MMEALLAFNSWLNGIVWGPPFMILLIGTGLYLTIRLHGFQFAYFGYAYRNSFGQLFRRTQDTLDGAITPFQAVASAMAGTVGVGNIAGVSTAIALGGPGAVFWMWMVALVGMATKFAEATLGLKFREIDADGRVSGGVFYYIEKGLGPKWKPLGMLYALLAGIAAFGIGNMVQANTVAHALQEGVNMPTWLTGIIVVALVGMVTIGGIRRIAYTAERIVPFMAVFYVLSALVIIGLNITAIPAAFGEIVAHAFSPMAPVGGFTGATIWQAMRFGIARGIFSNEAGLGAASIVHAQARNTPVGQGLWGIWEVFIDTIVICTMTALVIVVTGAYDTGSTGAALATSAFTMGLPGPGGMIVVIGLVLFAYTTMLTWNFYGEKSWEYLFGTSVVMPYRILFLGFLFVGAVGALEVIWSVADTLNGLMAAPNLIALIALAGTLVREKDAHLSGTDETRPAQSTSGAA